MIGELTMAKRYLEDQVEGLQKALADKEQELEQERAENAERNST